MHTPKSWSKPNWVKANLGKPGVKVVEVDVDTKAYDAGHIRGSVGFNWRTELQNQVGRDIIGKGGVREAPRRRRHLPGGHRDPLRGQPQLVRRQCVLAVQGLWPQGRAPDKRRPRQVAERAGRS
jgi:hypothetical protein